MSFIHNDMCDSNYGLGQCNCPNGRRIQTPRTDALREELAVADGPENAYTDAMGDKMFALMEELEREDGARKAKINVAYSELSEILRILGDVGAGSGAWTFEVVLDRATTAFKAINSLSAPPTPPVEELISAARAVLSNDRKAAADYRRATSTHAAIHDCVLRFKRLQNALSSFHDGTYESEEF